MDALDTQVHAALQRDLGRLEGKVNAMATQNEAMGADVRAVREYIEREKGSRKTLLTVGAALSAVIGGAASLIVAWFHR